MLMTVAAIPLLIRDVVFPIWKLRKVKDEKRRLTTFRSDQVYISAKKYYLSFLTPTSVGLLIIPLYLVFNIVYNEGANFVKLDRHREYTIINSSPKQIVLLSYGNKMLTAPFDDSIEHKTYAYKQEYSIRDVSELERNSFTTKWISNLQVRY
jgi:hypothetical protein